MADSVETSTLSLDGARKVLEAALAEARRIDVSFCIAVTDNAGHAILAVRMDRAPFASAPIALNKARTVVGFNGFSTAEWWPSIKDDPALVHGITHTPGLVIFGGGVGLFLEEKLVGAIGVSGGSTLQDEGVAAAGAAVLQR